MRPLNMMKFHAAFSEQMQDLAERAKHSGAVERELKTQIRNDDASDGAMELMLHDAIGDSWTGSDSKSVMEAVRAAKGRPIKVDVNSLGGSAYDGISIYNALATHDEEVSITISGVAYSAASIIAMAGDNVMMGEGTNFGIHPAWLFTMGNQYALADTVKWLQTLDAGLIDIYAARTGKSKGQITQWFTGDNNDGTMFSAEDAVKNGFADGMIPKKKKKKSESAAASVPSEVSSRLAKIREQQQAIRQRKIEEIRERLQRR